MLLRPSTSAGGGERVVAESSGKKSVEDPLLGFQYCDASFGSIPLLSPESKPDCCSSYSILGNDAESVLVPDTVSCAAVVISIGDDPIADTDGIAVWTVCVRGCVVVG